VIVATIAVVKTAAVATNNGSDVTAYTATSNDSPKVKIDKSI